MATAGMSLAGGRPSCPSPRRGGRRAVRRQSEGEHNDPYTVPIASS